jgi:hypothetical protein
MEKQAMGNRPWAMEKITMYFQLYTYRLVPIAYYLILNHTSIFEKR